MTSLDCGALGNAGECGGVETPNGNLEVCVVDLRGQLERRSGRGHLDHRGYPVRLKEFGQVQTRENGVGREEKVATHLSYILHFFLDTWKNEICLNLNIFS